MRGLHETFKKVYVAVEEKRLNIKFTNGMLYEDNLKYRDELKKLYNKEPLQIYALEMRCDKWRAIFISHLSKTMNNISEPMSKNDLIKIKLKFRSIPEMPSTPPKSDPRWARSKNLIDQSFKILTR